MNFIKKKIRISTCYDLVLCYNELLCTCNSNCDVEELPVCNEMYTLRTPCHSEKGNGHFVEDNFGVYVTPAQTSNICSMNLFFN